MTELTKRLAVEQTSILIKSYAFDLGKSSIEGFLQKWLDRYHASWIRLATIEALYLGRYKAVSIEQILGVWLRLGSPNTHFTHEFERLICRKLPTHLIDTTNFSIEKTAINSTNNYRHDDSNKTFQTSSKFKRQDELKQEAPLENTSDNALYPKPPEQNTEQNSSAEELAAATKKYSSSSDMSDIFARQLQTDSSSQHSEARASTQSSADNSISSNSSSNLISAMDVDAPYQADWSGLAAEQTPIHQFVPMPDVSPFYNKLKAFGREKLEEQ